MKLSSCSILILVLLAACVPPQEASKKSARSDDAATEASSELQMAATLKRSGDTSGSLKLLSEIVGKHPENLVALSQFGYTLIAANKPEQAVEIFDHMIELDASNAEAYNGKAVAFDHSGNHLAAQDLYQQALTLAPDSTSIKNNLGMSLILNGQVDQAIELLAPLEKQPAAGQTVRQNLALAYGIKGDKEKAMALNLKGLSPEQAQENMHFYEEYARTHPKSAEMQKHIGFDETPPEEKAEKPLSKPVILTKRPPKKTATPEKVAKNTDKDKGAAAKKDADTIKEATKNADLSPSAGNSSAMFEPVYNYPSNKRNQCCLSSPVK